MTSKWSTFHIWSLMQSTHNRNATPKQNRALELALIQTLALAWLRCSYVSHEWHNFSPNRVFFFEDLLKSFEGKRRLKTQKMLHKNCLKRWLKFTESSLKIKWFVYMIIKWKIRQNFKSNEWENWVRVALKLLLRLKRIRFSLGSKRWDSLLALFIHQRLTQWDCRRSQCLLGMKAWYLSL